jgi:hypothetical protein
LEQMVDVNVYTVYGMVGGGGEGGVVNVHTGL